jgi:N6-adenosine-specific RNA methylase IME4
VSVALNDVDNLALDHRRCHEAGTKKDADPEHSRKPDEFYKIIIDKTPGQTRCDLFSRQTRPGFDGWGNEAGKFDAPAPP